MKNGKVALIFILVIVLIIGVWYFSKVKTQEVSILQDFSKFSSHIETKTVSKEEAINTITKALKIMDNATFNVSKHEKELNNITEPTNFTIEEKKKYDITMNLITGEIMSYHNLASPRYKTTKKTEKQVVKVADEIIAKLELPATYECTFVYPFDDELWGMTYQAKYGELYNADRAMD